MEKLLNNEDEKRFEWSLEGREIAFIEYNWLKKNDIVTYVCPACI
jgi:hypothetical protein